MPQTSTHASHSHSSTTPKATSPTKAAIPKFEELYIFGDSLSDPGNLFALSGNTFPPPPYFEGRFSNGPLWSDRLGEGLGLTPATIAQALNDPLSTAQGVNFAIAGANSDDTNSNDSSPLTPPNTPPMPGLASQLMGYQTLVSRLGASALDNPLHTLWIGANDYLGGGQTNPQIVLKNISAALNQLYESGARTFLVGNLPPLGETPIGKALASEALNALSAAHNKGLEALLNQFELTKPDADFNLFDTNKVFTELQADPGAFGFTTTGGCFSLSDLATNPPVPSIVQACGETSLFWDDLHPTTKAHEFLAKEALLTLAVDLAPSKPSIALEKYINGVKADTPDAAIAIAPGDAITTQFEVTNSGNTLFQAADITITDAQVKHIHLSAESDIGSDGILSPGETWIYTASALAEDLSRSINFETDAASNSLQAGDSIDDEYGALGLNISTPDHDFGAMIFDSANPTGGDYDLRTPRSSGSGSSSSTGIGNTQPQGNVLIISEDGDSADPDDNATGGTLRFKWDNSVRLTGLDLLDIDLQEQTVTVETSQGNIPVQSYTAQNLGDNSHQTVELNGELADQLDLNLVHSGAVTGVSYMEIAHNIATVSVKTGDTTITASDSAHYTNFLTGAGASSLLEKQLGEVYDNTVQFGGAAGLSEAIAAGYRPFTPEFKGHGIHLFDRSQFGGLLQAGKNIDYAKPIGLNYDADGELLAGFYLAFPDNFLDAVQHLAVDAADGDQKASFGEVDWGEKPNIFADDLIANYPSREAEGWHQHASVYIDGIDFANTDATKVTFEQDLTPEEIWQKFSFAMASDDVTLFLYETQDFSKATAVLVPGFWMTHAWVHGTNSNGVFAHTNPSVSVNAPEGPGGHSFVPHGGNHGENHGAGQHGHHVI